MTKIEIYSPPDYTRGTVGEYIDHVIETVQKGHSATVLENAWAGRVIDLQTKIEELEHTILELRNTER